MLNITEVDPKQIKRGSNLFQSSFWARLKENRGYNTQAFHLDYRDNWTSIIMVHRPCTNDASFGYVPYGPDITIPSGEQGPFLEALSEKIRPLLPNECRFLRFDLSWPNPYAPRGNDKTHWKGPPEPRIREMRMNFGSRNWNLRKAPTDMQPTATVLINLKKSTAQILRGLHSKTRYCVRRAFREGVMIKVSDHMGLNDWYPIYMNMAIRKGIVLEDLAYFRKLFSTARKHDTNVRLYLGFQGEELLAGSIIAFHKSTAYYLHSASSIRGRGVFASYAMLWKAIMDAKAQGYRYFDLLGIPSTTDPRHPMHGLFLFKTRFGGEIIHFRGCWDYPYDETRYPALSFVTSLK